MTRDDMSSCVQKVTSSPNLIYLSLLGCDQLHIKLLFKKLHSLKRFVRATVATSHN